jgi:hypothetical protein
VWVAVGGGVPFVAVVVEQTAVKVIRGAASVGDDVAFEGRSADGPEPLFPFLGGLWFLIGVQEEIPADWAAAVLCLEQAQRALVQCWGSSVAPRGPVVGEGRVIG